MSNTFELWQKCLARQGHLAYMIAKAVEAGLTPFQGDIDRFRANEAEMRELETRFSEDT